MTDKIKLFSVSRLLLLTLGLASGVWLFESSVHAFIFEPDKTFLVHLIRPPLHELWMRITVIAAFMGFGIYSHFHTRSKQLAERALTESLVLKERADWLRQSYDQSAIGIAENTHDGRITNANPAFANMLGYTREELVQMRVSDIEMTEDHDENFRLIEKILSGELDSFEMEKRYIRKDGTILWGHLSVSHSGKEWSGEEFFIGQIQDITDRKRAEGRLEDSELRLRTVSDSTKDAIVMMDNEGKISFWNQGAVGVFGYSRDEAIGRLVHDFLIPSDLREAAHKGVHDFGSSGEGTVIGSTSEWIANRKDGSLVPVELCISKVKIDGEWNAVGVARDISDRKISEQALFVSNEKLNIAFSQAPIGMAITTLEGKFQRANKVTCDLLGCDETELIGRDWQSFTHPDDIDINQRLRQHLIDTDETSFTTEKRYALENGERWGLLNTSLVRDEHGQPLYFLAHVQDITDRKAQELAVARATDLSETLNRLNETINSSPDLTSTLDEVMETARAAIGSDTALLMQRSSTGWERWKATSKASSQPAISLPYDSFDHLFKGKRGGGSHISNDPQAVMQIPLSPKRGEPLVLGFAHLKEAAFTEVDLDFTKKLAASLELAIENSRMFEEEKRIADTFQESSLVMPQKVDGVRFGHIYHSATEAAKVGGDFYDLFQIDDNKVAAVIGDVSGKGIEAAALAAEVKTTLRAYCHSEQTPASALALTNQMLMNRTTGSQFVTVLLAILDTKTHEAVYCSAGHPPPIYRRNTSSNVLLTTGSPILGAFANTKLTEARLQLEHGDTLVLYTDGVTEARHHWSREMFNSSRVVASVRDNPEISCRDLPQALFNSVSLWSGGHLPDDVAILSLTLGDN